MTSALELSPLPADVLRALAVERCRPAPPESVKAALLARLETMRDARPSPALPFVALGLALLMSSGCVCGDPRLGNVHVSIEAQPASVDFGTVVLPDIVVRRVNLVSRGAAELEVHAITLHGDAVDQFAVGALSAAGQLEVRFVPTREGTHSAYVSIESNADDSPELFVPLVGTARLEGGCVECAVDAGEFDGGSVTPEPDAGAYEDAGTPDYYVTTGHEELRSLTLGHPLGAQRWVSNDTRAEFVNATGAPVEVTIRLRDMHSRFFWSSGFPMAQRPEVVTVVPAHARVAPSLQWNSPDDNGTTADPCGRTANTTAVEYIVDGGVVARVSVHGRSRDPFSCPAALVTWSATSPNSGGPCRAHVPVRLENLASSAPEEVAADALASDTGYTGSQGVTCNASAWMTDACGARIPTAGAPVTAYARNAGMTACDGP